MKRSRFTEEQVFAILREQGDCFVTAERLLSGVVETAPWQVTIAGKAPLDRRPAAGGASRRERLQSMPLQ